ncbi:tyrosine-type recombinase/integrase [Methanobrevibacter arboriphilus]|uniref:tyrosine-type recombinase/integrase n=1 Tax=Methanobrevibacter arboriphilus TaxID=39441 RepID=UPI0009EAEC8C|nr:tyrosine-type recombinase/integrase [Methanobrevibacter arboriphilus]
MATLKISDIDFDKKEITFNLAKKEQETKLTLILPDDLSKEIAKQIHEKNKVNDDYLFLEKDVKIDGFLRNMRTYLERNSNKLIKELTEKDISLNTHYFRRLRGGQHPYISGNDLEIIQSLYVHQSLDQTIEYLQIKEIEVNKMLLKSLN